MASSKLPSAARPTPKLRRAPRVVGANGHGNRVIPNCLLRHRGFRLEQKCSQRNVGQEVAGIAMLSTAQQGDAEVALAPLVKHERERPQREWPLLSNGLRTGKFFECLV